MYLFYLWLYVKKPATTCWFLGHCSPSLKFTQTPKSEKPSILVIEVAKGTAKK